MEARLPQHQKKREEKIYLCVDDTFFLIGIQRGPKSNNKTVREKKETETEWRAENERNWQVVARVITNSVASIGR